ncbi:MAG: molybdopterin cofactor-binding domain-containing protein, partial [Mariprofundaceae bacterium]
GGLGRDPGDALADAVDIGGDAVVLVDAAKLGDDLRVGLVALALFRGGTHGAGLGHQPGPAGVGRLAGEQGQGTETIIAQVAASAVGVDIDSVRVITGDTDVVPYGGGTWASRGAGIGGGNDEREQTLNQLLVEMDGFESNEGVILVAATNRPDVLDPALLRPGRFDRQVVVPRPDLLGRQQILKVHMKKVPLNSDVDVKVLARGTPGFSGADLANLVNEAALNAARYDRDKVGNDDFENAKDKVMMGAERRSMVMSEDEKRLTAYHEAGHALVGIHMPKHDPLHKVTIIPRGRALGVTMNLPERDRLSQSRIELESRLASLFGGRVAEELVFGEENITTGAGHDIQQATSMARAMVTEYGFSKKLGPLRYSENEEEIFLGRSITQSQHMSDETAQIIDAEVRSLVEAGESKARKVLTTYRKDLNKIAEALLEFETLSGKEVDALLRGEKIVREDPEKTSAAKKEEDPVESIDAGADPKDDEIDGKGSEQNS